MIEFKMTKEQVDRINRLYHEEKTCHICKNALGVSRTLLATPLSDQGSRPEYFKIGVFCRDCYDSLNAKIKSMKPEGRP